MTTTAARTAIRNEITVQAPVERAFALFTDGIDGWWPREHTIGAAPMAKIVLEPRAGGRAYTIDVNGDECDWGRVLAYEPPSRVVFSWDITVSWQPETDPQRCSEVEVRFSAQGAGHTLVELEHRRLDRHGEGWEHIRDAVASDGGWARTLASYADAVLRTR